MLFDLAMCATPQYAIIVESPDASAVEVVVEELLAPLQPLREQIIAITGLGLEFDEETAPYSAQRGSADVPAMGLSLSYLAAGDPLGQRVVFVHGSPGVGEEWAAMLANVPRLQYRIAPDRPGFGETLPADPVESLVGQAAALRPLIAPGDGSRTILVGYSYGGPVALRAAIDMPEAVSGLLLISAAADPTEEEVHPLQALLDLEPFAELLPEDLANANSELLALKDELAAMAEDIRRLEIPVTIIHGLQDTLVPPENVLYLHEHLSSASPVRIVLVEDGDHFLPWSHVGQINAALACLLGDTQDEPR